MSKKAGVLLHISSLPNPYGIGTLGSSAYMFVDFLEAAGQKLWQVLPIGPTSFGDSPYQSSSVYAFNPYFIDLDILSKKGLLQKEDYENLDFGCNELDVDYSKLFIVKNSILKKTYEKKDIVQEQFLEFCKENSFWLEDYALFFVIKEFFGNVAWNEWPKEYRLRDKKTLTIFRDKHFDEIETVKFIQYLFYDQWVQLKKYANDKGIEIIGDMPIYVAYDSADVWSYPTRFDLDENLNPIEVAGCPPDDFAEDGQLWGNPLYNWEHMAMNNYSWWVERIKMSMKIFDIVRIDHFRGFAGYFAIKFGEPNARNGVWKKGPGYDLFKAVNEKLPDAKIIAENLGFLDEDVHKLLNQCGYPGMVIAEFEFGDGNSYSPMRGNFSYNNVIYTGTHDNQTIASFYEEQPDEFKDKIDDICSIYFHHKPWLRIIERIFRTEPKFAIVPLQDYLGLLDDEGRMNIPSTLGKNWRYRARLKDFSPRLARYMKQLTIESGRYYN